MKQNTGTAGKRYTLFTGKQLLWLILPIVIEQIFSTSLGFFDSMMVSNMPGAEAIRSNASNAIGNVDCINNLIIMLFSAFATGGAIVTSQFLGAGDREKANKVAKQLLMLVICIALGIGVLCLILNWPILKLFYGNVADSTFAYQRTYFYVTAASFPFIGLFNASAAILRAQRKSVSSMASAAMSCISNIILNAFFLFVLKMGVLGAGLATVLCRVIPAVFLLRLLANPDNIVRVRIFERFSFDPQMLRAILKLAIPSGVESGLFQLGKLMTNTFVNIGVYATGPKSLLWLNGAGQQIHINIQANGNTIANQVNNFASVVGGGIGTSCLTVIGQSVGAGDPDQVRYYMKKMLILSYICNGICGGLILLFMPAITGLYGYTEEAKEIARHCLYFCLALQVLTYPLSFTAPGILKATSDVKYVMCCAVLSMFITRVGLAFLMTTDRIPGLPQLGAIGYWIGMCSDWVVRSILFSTRLLSGRWKRASGLLKEQTQGPEDVPAAADDRQ